MTTQDPDTMARIAENGKTMHLDMPEPRFESIIPADQDASSPEGVAPMPEEEAQSVVGVSISKMQTRLMSPTTPAAEKAAAMEEMDGMFRGALEDGDANEILETAHEHGEHFGRPHTPGKQQTGSPTQHQATLPSPWRAAPRRFEKVEPKHQEQEMGPTGMLADLNVRRYMSTFSLPSLPKTPNLQNLKDFSVPSLSSILGSARSHSPLRKTGGRPSRASTLVDSTPTWDRYRQSHRHSVQPLDNFRSTRYASRSPDRITPHTKSQSPIRAERPIDRNNDLLQSPTRQARLRRSTSDQSLILSRVTSAGSSLGDDSRWENVREQVNSRAKAIVDSWHDSNIIPSMPNLSSIYLGALRPEFTRSRVDTETKSPGRYDNGNGHSRSVSDHTVNELGMSQGRQAVTGMEIAKHKSPKSMHPQLDNALEHLTGDIVIMGGYRGSILRSAKLPHRQLWVPVKVGLNIRRVNLEVGFQPEDEENMDQSIFASGMLSHIGPVDMGRRLLKGLRTCKNARSGKLRVHDYGYDWRLSPYLLSQRLIDFLENLPCNGPGRSEDAKGATIIAHSMGGLITRHAINQRPELAAGVVYAGVPQYCINILGPIRNGDEVLLSSKVLTAQVNFSFRSTFVLLPDNGKCFIDKETKEEYPVDFFDSKVWKEHAFSPCIAPVLPPAASSEKKSLLGSLSDSLPSLPSLPKRSLTLTSDSKPNITDTSAGKVSTITPSSPSRSVDFQSQSPANTSTTLSPKDAHTYLTRTLAETLTFRRELAHNLTHTANNAYPPLAIIYATNTPTVVAARVASRDGIRRADAYDDLAFASGDGVCLARAAQLPEGYRLTPGGRVRTERGHVGLLGDLEGVGRCLEAVWRGRKGGTGLGVKE